MMLVVKVCPFNIVSGEASRRNHGSVDRSLRNQLFTLDGEDRKHVCSGLYQCQLFVSSFYIPFLC